MYKKNLTHFEFEKYSTARIRKTVSLKSALQEIEQINNYFLKNAK